MRFGSNLVRHTFLSFGLSLGALLLGLVLPSLSQAQRGESADAGETEPASDDDSDQGDAEETTPGEGAESAASDDEDERSAAEEEDDEDEDYEPQLRAPAFDPVELGEEAEAEEGEEDEGEDGPSPEDDGALLEQAAPPSSDPTQLTWTSPERVLTLNGYFRVRGELQDSFFLGRGTEPQSGQPEPPFSAFRPLDRDSFPAGGCRSAVIVDDNSVETQTANNCGGSDRLRYANMRLRLRPTLSLSDDVRVHMMVDVFDNLVLGSTPDNQAFVPSGSGFSRQLPDGEEAVLRVPNDTLTTTQNPPESFRNSSDDSVLVRRAWGEVTNRGLGQLRFGRMGSHWGLGMLWNEGAGIDGDFSTEVDRIMGITKIKGVYFIASWDFVGQGVLRDPAFDLRSPALDATAADDIRQNVFAVAYRLEADEQARRLRRGDFVLNGGLYFQWRRQKLSSAGFGNAFPDDDEFVARSGSLVRRGAKVFTPDLWGQFLWKGLRIEAEAAFVAGRIQNLLDNDFQDQGFKLRQFGLAFESEYRLLQEKLGITLYAGYASGDRDVDGLSDQEDTVAQRTTDRTISNFEFHPNYRVDLILWRNIMGRVGGAWYLKPGIGYELIRTPFGQRLGAKFDVIYSQASQPVQAYGGDAPLGVELDFSLYYRSEDGPGLVDGFFAQGQYALLIPLRGLGYRTFNGMPEVTGGNPGLKNAQALRLILGVQF